MKKAHTERRKGDKVKAATRQCIDKKDVPKVKISAYYTYHLTNDACRGTQ